MVEPAHAGYPPGPRPPYRRPPPRRSAIPLGMGITLLVGGGLLALGGLSSGAMGILGSAMPGGPYMQPGMEITPQLESAMEPMAQTQLASAILNLIQGALSVLAIVAGVGLVRYRAWGRKLGLLWATAAVVFVLASLVAQFEMIRPMARGMTEMMTAQMEAQGSPPPPPGMFEEGLFYRLGAAAVIFNHVLLAITPIVAWALLTRPSAERACGDKE